MLERCENLEGAKSSALLGINGLFAHRKHLNDETGRGLQYKAGSTLSFKISMPEP